MISTLEICFYNSTRKMNYIEMNIKRFCHRRHDVILCRHYTCSDPAFDNRRQALVL